MSARTLVLALAGALLAILSIVALAGSWEPGRRPAAVGPSPTLRSPDPSPSRTAAPPDRQSRRRKVRGAPILHNFELVGHHDLGGKGFNADVWVHERHAYVGIWGRGLKRCPGTAVRVVNVTDPGVPSVVARLDVPRKTTGEDVVVRAVRTRRFAGDLAAVGIQACDSDLERVFRGLAFFDVTDPDDPVALGRWFSGPRTIGCHEIDLIQRPDRRVLAACASPYAEAIDPGLDEVVLIDATDPRRPLTAGGWTLGRDAGQRRTGGVGCDARKYAHSVRFSRGGDRLWASYWDAGTITLDVAEPAMPTMLAQTLITPPDGDGDNHSMTPALRGRILIINPEDFSPTECPSGPDPNWAQIYLWDASDPGPGGYLGRFATKNSRTSKTNGIYSPHNTEVLGADQAFSSWFSDGIVWWTFDASGRTRKLGSFVPPRARDPRGLLPRVPIVWGVAIQRTRGGPLVFASDINSGLWIVRPSR